MARSRFPTWLDDESTDIEMRLRRVILENIAEAMREEIEAADIGTTGRLAKSIKIDVYENKVVMTAPYAEYVEEGRRPGRYPPFEEIRLWVRRKFGITKKRQLRNVTWAVMHKIYKRGIPGKHIYRRALERALK